MTLPESVKEYYFSHIEELSEDKQFHFASRIATWASDVRAQKILNDFKPQFKELSHPANFKLYVNNMMSSPPQAKINASEVRSEYFRKYPNLRSIDFILFKVRHAFSIYDLDFRELLKSSLDEDDIRELCLQISNDAPAMRVLSTYAVNLLYLSELLLKIPNISPTQFIQIAQDYSTSTVVDIQLYIYLFTHCIIGASNFYIQVPPAKDIPYYLKMLEELEVLINTNYQRINLDNKLEFLVCARICNYNSNLDDRIYEECSKSVSNEGTFLIDRYNDNHQSNKTSLNDSEHRNVLYIMSATSFHGKRDYKESK